MHGQIPAVMILLAHDITAHIKYQMPALPNIMITPVTVLSLAAPRLASTCCLLSSPRIPRSCVNSSWNDLDNDSVLSFARVSACPVEKYSGLK